MRIGLDFGTTNSGAAAFDGQRVHVFPLDPDSHDPTVVRSTLYITRDHGISIGQEAINDYYRQNIGRPIKMVRQRVEEGKVALRNVRREVLDDMREFEKEKLVSEDDFYRGKEDLQELTDDYTKKMDEISDRKQREILEG